MKIMFKFIGVFLLLFLMACSAPTIKPLPFHKSRVIQSTWYGGTFHGKKTASGEIFDSTKFTAAHVNLPLGSWVKVENQVNQRSLVLKINDRKPPRYNSADLDVSRSAAEFLGFAKKGKQQLTLYSLPIPNEYEKPKRVKRDLVPLSVEYVGERAPENTPIPNKEELVVCNDKFFNRFNSFVAAKHPLLIRFNLKKFLRGFSV